MSRPELRQVPNKEIPTKDLMKIKKMRTKSEKRLKRWNKLPKSDTENKCWFRSWIVEKHGEEMACKTLDTEYDECPLHCEWILKCPSCGGLVIKHILSKDSDTSGKIFAVIGAACPNKDCDLNKKKSEQKPVKEKGEPNYYV